ncbi:unnamed protein product [Urochloa humidicola]
MLPSPSPTSLNHPLPHLLGVVSPTNVGSFTPSADLLTKELDSAVVDVDLPTASVIDCTATAVLGSSGRSPSTMPATCLTKCRKGFCHESLNDAAALPPLVLFT